MGFTASPEMSDVYVKTPELKKARPDRSLRLAHPVEDCQPLASRLKKERCCKKAIVFFKRRREQDGMLSQWSGREPVSQIGTIRRVFPPGAGWSFSIFF